MQYLSHLIHAFFMFVAPLSFLNYKTTVIQKILFTLIYGTMVHFSRQIYNLINIPFGSHTLILVILAIILFKNILKDFTWIRSTYISLVLFIILIINDSIFVLPYMKFFHLTITQMEINNVIPIIFKTIVSNSLLVLIFIIGELKNRRKNYAIKGEEAKNEKLQV